MKFKNTTRIPDSLLREVIRFCCPASVTKYSIWFKNYRPDAKKAVAFCGRAYCCRSHVVCRIPRFIRLKAPYLTEAQPGGYRPWNAYTYEEALVGIVAHELNHLAQFKNPRLYRRTWGARGRLSEIDCDTYALRMIRAWRAVKGLATMAPANFVIRTGPKPLTPRQRLEALAKPYGVHVCYDDPHKGTIYVNAPDSLCDKHGEMPDDPFYDNHYHDSYAEAKEAIETYAKLAEAKALGTSRVDSLSPQIGVDGMAQA